MSKFVNIYDYESVDYPFQFFIGVRGVGKTYSALSAIKDRKIILMRRTADELELLLDINGAETGNPFKTLNRDKDWNIGLSRINSKVCGIYERQLDGDKLIPVGAPLGLGVALSTVSKVRGMDFSDYTDLIYDECVPEKHVKRMRGESDAVLNAYETMNRNREMLGLPPMRVWFLSNSNDIYNPLFVGLGIVADVEKMVRAGKNDLYIKERGLAVHLFSGAGEFVESKKETAIAKLTKGSDFYEMAYENKFAYNDFTNVGYRRITGYVPICSIDDKAFLYRKKGEKEIYVSYSSAKTEDYKSSNEADAIRFYREYGVWLKDYYVAGRLYFESYELKQILLTLLQ